MSAATEATDLALLARSSAWLLASRLIAMGIGLLGLPILMTALGPLHFGAWAVLLGGTFAFGTLELGMSSAVMRWATLAFMPEAKTLGASHIDAVMSNSLFCAALVFTLAGVPLFLYADALAQWLQLPDTPLLTPGQCIEIVYLTVAVIALLRCTIAPMLAARRMDAHAFLVVAQSIAGATANWTVASITHRLDLLLIANTLSIVFVQVLGAWWTHRRMPWRFRTRLLDTRLARAMLGYGSALQFSDMSTFFMYQFDKLIISGVVTPAEVTHYEVASRSAQALGNVSTSPFVAFAPTLTERHLRAEDPSDQLLGLLRLTLLGVGFFLILPLAVAPIGLFAWVGQIGYHAAGVFALLALSVISTALVMPLSVCAQAMGRASMELARAGSAMLINIPLSIALIHEYGKEGAALGTLAACLIANAVFAWWLLRALALSPRRIRQTLLPLLIPIVLTALVVAALTRAIEPWVIASRWYMAPAAAGLYAGGAIVLMRTLLRQRRFSADEQALLRSLPVVGRYVRFGKAGDAADTR